MTDLHNKQEVVSPFLTETTVCPVQIQEGMFRELLAAHAPLTPSELERYLDYEYSILTRRKGGPYLSENDDAWLDYTTLKEKMLAHIEVQVAERPRRKAHAGYELGAREFTLTYSPKWLDDSEARTKMMKAIDRLCKYYVDEIVELRAVGEVGTNGLSHIHCFYKLRGGLKITDKNFKRAWEYWNPKKKIGHGFEGGHHASVKEEADFRGYIDKDIATAWFEKNVANTS